MSTPYYGQPVNVGSFSHLTATTAGTLLKTGEGALYSLTINTPVATGVITLYDGLSTAGTVIAVITIPVSPMSETLTFNAYFATGLFIVVATANQDITIVYK